MHIYKTVKYYSSPRQLKFMKRTIQSCFVKNSTFIEIRIFFKTLPFAFCNQKLFSGLPVVTVTASFQQSSWTGDNFTSKQEFHCHFYAGSRVENIPRRQFLEPSECVHLKCLMFNMSAFLHILMPRACWSHIIWQWASKPHSMSIRWFISSTMIGFEHLSRDVCLLDVWTLTSL